MTNIQNAFNGIK